MNRKADAHKASETEYCRASIRRRGGEYAGAGAYAVEISLLRRASSATRADVSIRELTMNVPTGRKIRLALTTLGFAGLIVALNAVPATATPANGFVGTLLARGTDQSNGTIPIKQGLDIVVQENTVQPGGTSGWHSHPGGAIVVIKQGEITIYESVGNHCVITRYTAGQAFVEPPDQVVIAKNTGTSVTISYATFPGVPVGVAGAQRTDEADPHTCPI
jgi:quercetin dioxygenase-like cupin family protein